MSLAAQAVPFIRRLAAVAVTLAIAASPVATPALAVAAAAAPDSRPIQLHWDGDDGVQSLPGSMYNVARQIGASTYWSYGYTGSGVDVAVIDSGVAPVVGLDRPGKVIYGPDVSFESGVPELHNLDTFGHGTHMAGIIAGRSDGFKGIAPGARIVSLKAADALGRSSVGQVIAAIKWVVEHRNSNGLNIRVLNLSFGATVERAYQHDDLAYAVEQAWQAGIVVVVSGGNNGTSSGGLSDPAYDPFVIAVGADNAAGTITVSDDSVTDFSSRGNGDRNPDIVAPAKGIVSLRVAGSYLDQSHESARVGDQFFRGSGTSQAAAVVSGAAALIIQQRPWTTPDRVKQTLLSTARAIPGATAAEQGAGLISLGAAFGTWTPTARQEWTASLGNDGNAWASADASGNSWSTAEANGNSWSSNVWTGSGWTDAPWSGGGYSPDGNSWSSVDWLGVSWGKPKPKGRTVTPPLPDANEAGITELGVSWGKRSHPTHPTHPTHPVTPCSRFDHPGRLDHPSGSNLAHGSAAHTGGREMGVSWGRGHNNARGMAL